MAPSARHGLPATFSCAPNRRSAPTQSLFKFLATGRTPTHRRSTSHLPELNLPNRAGAVEIHTEALSFPGPSCFRHRGGVLPRGAAQPWWRDLAGPSAGSGGSLRGPPPPSASRIRGRARRMLAIKGLVGILQNRHRVSPLGWSAIVTHAERRQILDMLSRLGSAGPTACSSWTAPDELLRHACRAQPMPRLRSSVPARLYGLRADTLFIADKLNFAFAPATLGAALRRGTRRALAALSHVGFLWRRRGQMAKRWLGR